MQNADHVMILAEMVHDVRIIRLGEPDELPEQLRPWFGDSWGHWDGNTLVIDTSGFVPYTWFDRAGNYHSDALHVVERYTMMGPNHIDYEATIEDPQVLTEPFTIKMPLYRRMEENARIMDFRCVEFVEELLFGEWRRTPLPR